jgi:hypothetical protein
MDRVVAERLMKVLLQFGEPFNAATESTDQIADDQERRAVRRPLGEIGVRLFQAMLPIIRQYPDLDPDKDEAWLRR